MVKETHLSVSSARKFCQYFVTEIKKQTDPLAISTSFNTISEDIKLPAFFWIPAFYMHGALLTVRTNKLAT